MHHRSIVFVLATLSIASSCGDSSAPTQSRADAAEIWRSAGIALVGAGVFTTDDIEASIDADGLHAIVEGAADCPDGGRLEITHLGHVGDAIRAEIGIELVQCRVDEVVIDGSLELLALIEQGRIRAEYHADLDLGGSLAGSCVVDAVAEVAKAGLSASVSGSVCGHDWADL